MDVVEAPSINKGTSFLGTCLNGLNTHTGIGILSIPYTLSQGGWLSIILFTLVAIITYYTGILLRRCMDSNDNIKTYPDIGEFAFGRKGRWIVATLMYLDLYMVSVEFLILEGDNMDKLFPAAASKFSSLHISSKQAFVIFTTIIVLPTTWFKNLGVLAYMSIGGVVSSLLLVGCVILVGAIDNIGFQERGTLMRWNGVPMAMSFFIFCFSGHAVFPTIYSSMRDKTKFSMVLLSCFAFCALQYATIAIFGYLMYGSKLKSQITLNLPTGLLSSKIAIYTTLLNPLTKYALMITPISSGLESWITSSMPNYASFILRTLLVLSTMIIALTIPFFGYIMALIGSILSMSATILLPCLCYLKIFQDSRRLSVELVMIIMIMSIGMFIVVIGTYISMKEIVNGL